MWLDMFAARYDDPITIRESLLPADQLPGDPEGSGRRTSGRTGPAPCARGYLSDAPQKNRSAVFYTCVVPESAQEGLSEREMVSSSVTLDVTR